MSNLNLRKKLAIKFLNISNEIIKYLQLGTNIPIWHEFHKYILNDLKYFQAKSMLLQEDGNPIGHILIYDEGGNTLYFGYFGVINHDADKIAFIIDKLLKYAKKNNYKLIRGPINIPAIIFGWGFMKEGSEESLYIGKPVNPPIYQDSFLKKGFFIKHEDKTWMGAPYPRINPWKIKKYDFDDYEYFNPVDIDDFLKLKSEFLRIHAENLPSSSQITPNVAGVVDNYIEFIFHYGYNFMIFFVRYKPTSKIVACGSYLPNPFRKNDNGNYDSCVLYSWAVEPEHRRKGLVMLMYGATSLQLWKEKFRYASGPVPADNVANTAMAYKLGGINSRIHLILEYKL